MLVVDDDEDTRDMIAALLLHAGYTVETACNGRDALAVLRTVRPELILLDVQMPEMNGSEFREAQRRHQDLIKIPTVVMTGVESEPVLDVAVAEALRKPVRRDQLLAIVAHYCTSRTRMDT